MTATINRRQLGGYAGAAVGVVGAPQAAHASSSDLRIVDLKVEGLAQPRGVEASQPQFSWRMDGKRADARQTAYRILVGDDRAQLASGHASLWDSGRIASDRSTGLRYSGQPLKSRQTCWWTVQVWDEAGRRLSDPPAAFWEMGLIDPADWTAQWIAIERESDQADREAGVTWISPPGPINTKPQGFQRRFSLPSPATAARIMVIARDQFDAVFFDGSKLPYMPPPAGNYGPPPAAVFELGALAAGDHNLSVQIHALPQLYPGAPKSKCAFAALIWVRLTDGREIRIPSDVHWRAVAEPPVGWEQSQQSTLNWHDAVPAATEENLPWPPTPAMYARTNFKIDRPVKSARLYITTLGAYYPYLNGAPVGDALLAPESQDFRKRIRYRVHDVTANLVQGENVLGALVGDGWYGSAVAPNGRFSFGSAPRRLLAQLELTYSNGERQVIGTNADWTLAPSSILASEIYNGEICDQRLAQDDWCRPGTRFPSWRRADLAEKPLAHLTAQIDPPIRITQTIGAKSISEPASGVYVVDFGQNFAGFCRLKLKGAAGSRVELRFGEVLKADGLVDQSNLRGAKATDVYVVRGDEGGEVFQPHFTYHGFRYVEVHGYPGALPLDGLVGLVIHSDLPFTGKLSIDNDLIEGMWRNTVWSQRSNFVGIPTDCPQRDERLGWMGDANVFWDAAAFNMDVYAFTQRFCEDIRDAQSSSGAFSEFAPQAVKMTGEAAPGWADAGVVLPWTSWWRYGDDGVVAQQWSAMTHYLNYVAQNNPDFVWRHGRGADFGDWLALDAKQPWDATTPKDLIATAFWAKSVELMVDMAKATGRSAEAVSLAAQHAKIVAAFQSEFVKGDGTVGNGSQTGYIVALRFGLLPDALRPIAAEHLVADIRRRGTLLSTGFLGTPYSLDALAEADQGGLIYDLLLRTAYPSWGYMISKGATTMWERWNGDTGDVGMSSFNHYALGAVSGFLFRRIAGIEPIAPGFAKIRVKPIIDPRVRHGGGEYWSVRGRIKTDWKLGADGSFTLDLEVPPNVLAEVHLPLTGGKSYREGRREIRIGQDHRVKAVGNALVVDVGSGHRTFRGAV